MAPSKRPASADRLATKRARNAAKDKCSEVVSVLGKAEDLPKSVRAMLQGMGTLALSTKKEERHAFQAAIADMVGEVLTSVESGAVATVQELQAKVEGVHTDKANRRDALAAAEQGIGGLKEAASQQEAAVQTSSETLAAAKKALAAAEKAQASGDDKLQEAEAKKSQLDNAQKNILEPLKGRAAENAEVKALVSLGTDFDFDPSFLKALPSVLKKDPSSRVGFDLVTLEQLDQEITKALAEHNTVIEGCAPAKGQREAAVVDAKAAFEEAVEKHAVAKEALKAAQAAEQDGEAAVQAAKEAVSNFYLDTKTMMDEYDNEKAWLAELRAGPLVAFEELNATALPPPESQGAEAAAA